MSFFEIFCTFLVRRGTLWTFCLTSKAKILSDIFVWDIFRSCLFGERGRKRIFSLGHQQNSIAYYQKHVYSFYDVRYVINHYYAVINSTCFTLSFISNSESIAWYFIHFIVNIKTISGKLLKVERTIVNLFPFTLWCVVCSALSFVGYHLLCLGNVLWLLFSDWNVR